MENLKNHENVPEYFDQFDDYDVYYKGPWEFYRKQYVELINKQFESKRNISVLDLGCGRMCSLPWLLSDERIETYDCVDSSEKSIAVLKARFESVDKLKVYSDDISTYIENCNDKYDLVIFFGVVMYFERESALELFSKLNSVLKPDGLLVLHEPSTRAEGRLDEYSLPMERKFLDELVKCLSNASITTYKSFNILPLRKLGSFVLRKLSITQTENTGRFHNVVWKTVVRIEAFLSRFPIGLDSMIVINKRKNNEL